METKTKVRLIVTLCISLLCILSSSQQVSCNPLAFNPLFAYPYHPAAALQAPIIMNPRFDPYLAAQVMNPWPYGAGRRSLPGVFGKMQEKKSGNSNKHQLQQNEPADSDEQKALDGLPMSLIDPDPPSTITERLSESFTAINEGVKNHFRSISENFSDTLDDIKEVWKSPEKESKKQKS